MRKVKTLAWAVTVAFTAGVANAATVGMNIYNSTKAGGTNTAATEVEVRVWDMGSEYKFTFINNSSIQSSINKLHFDNSLSGMLGEMTAANTSAGVLFDQASNTNDPPFGEDIGWSGSLVVGRSVGATDAEKIDNGIAHGGKEILVIKFTKIGGTLANVLDLLQNTGGIAAHLVDLEGNGLKTNVDLSTFDGSLDPDAVDNNPPTQSLPTPTSAMAGLALMSVLVSRRKRFGTGRSERGTARSA
ncbi:MAG: hypothetical protein IT445_10850 [Phycisphaeraceae bacterium]|nr:hypothetical protein [Phycisphaeraceae bacterium]